MHVHAFAISAICICITATSAFAVPKSAGDSGGIKGAANDADCIICKPTQWQTARGKRNSNDQGRG